MISSETQSGKHGLTVRLFNLIENLPRPQQLKLLRQIIGDRINEHLFKLIIEMSEEQQLQLLDQVGTAPEMDPPEKTVSLEGTEPSMRENLRKSCLINASYTIRGRSFRSYILDISIGGVYVETSDRFTVGEPITLNFSLPDKGPPFAMRGVIAWSGPQGFGVRFEGLAAPQDTAIRSFVQQGAGAPEPD